MGLNSQLSSKSWEKLLLSLGIMGYLLLLVITFAHKQPPLFDEILFIPNVHLFEKYGFSKEFLLKMHNQAPGPLFQLIHSPLKPLTQLTTPGIRLVNVVFLAFIILLLSKIISLINGCSLQRSLLIAINIIAVPMVWQVSGMALTEIPAMLFASLSLLFLFLAVKLEEESLIKSSTIAAFGGTLLGLAILGRSPFLMVTFASFTLLINRFKSIRRWTIVLLYTGFAFAVCTPVFVIWKGLVPPQQAFIGSGGIAVWHGILAFAYAALLTLIIAPQFFFYDRKIPLVLILLYFIFLASNILFLHYTYYPLSEVLEKVFPPGVMEVYPFLISPFLAALAFYFIASCIYQAWAKRTNTIFLFILFSAIFLLASTFKVTHLFSTRYVAQAAPFFVVLSSYYDENNIYKFLRFLIGMIIGILSLETYFQFQ